jgi:hypothetical protein
MQSFFSGGSMLHNRGASLTFCGAQPNSQVICRLLNASVFYGKLVQHV